MECVDKQSILFSERNTSSHSPHGLHRHRFEYVLLAAHTHAKPSVDNESLISYCS